MTQIRPYLLQYAGPPLVVIAGLWATTQWAAHALGYQPALGPAWFDVFGWRLYPPWRLFPWWLSFDAQAPAVFARAGIAAAVVGILSGLVGLGGAAWRGSSRNRVNTTYGSARWADRSDVVRSGLLGVKGVILGSYEGRYLRHNGPEHVLAVAPTRSGKGVGLVLPTLLSWTESVVVHDLKGENWKLTAGWRAQFSHCLLFDPTNPRSAKFNPLLEVRKGPMEMRDVQNIADILVDPEGAHERRDHWEKTSHALLVGAILHVLYAEADKTLARVATLLSDPERTIVRVLQTMLTTNHIGTPEAPKVHPAIASIARELQNKSEAERSGVVSTAMTYLALYRDPIIAGNTARSDWRIADLVTGKQPVSLYLVVPPSDLSRTRPLVRLILNQIGRRLTEHLAHVGGEPRQYQLLLMLDEFPALGRLDFFETSLAFFAGYRVRAFLIAQSLHQIDKAYGLNHAILDNCHVRVAFAANDERTAKRLSDALGTATEMRSLRNVSGKRLAAFLSHMSISQQETPRPLLTSGEILQLPSDDALVLLAGMPPIRARKLQYFRDQNFLSRCRPAPQLTQAHYRDVPPKRDHDWGDRTRSNVQRLVPLATPKPAAPTGGDDRPKHVTPPELKTQADHHHDLPLFKRPAAHAPELDDPSHERRDHALATDQIIGFPGLKPR